MVSHVFGSGGANFPTANFPQLAINSGTGFSHPSLDFDASTEESCNFGFLPTDIGTGDITVDVYWISKSATTGKVVWGAAIMAVTPDTEDVRADGYGTVGVNGTGDTPGSAAGEVIKSTITLSTAAQKDSIAAGDDAYLKLYRDADDVTNDTMAGVACLLKVELSYASA